MDLEKNFSQEKQYKPTEVGEKDTFNSLKNSDEVDELMKTVNDTENDAECHTSAAVHEQDFNYMDELLSYIGDVDQDGVENMENNYEEDSELTNLLEAENNSDSIIDRFVIRDIISPMSIDSGIGSDSGAMATTKSSNHPGFNYNQRLSFLDPSYSITPSSSPVLRSSTPGFEPEYYSTLRSNTPTSHSSCPTSRSSTPSSQSSSPTSLTSRSSTPTSHSSSPTFNSKHLQSTTNYCVPTSCLVPSALSSNPSPSTLSSNPSPSTLSSKPSPSTLSSNPSPSALSSNPSPSTLSSKPSPSNSNPSIISSNPSSTSANSLPVDSESSLSCVNPSTTIPNFPSASSSSPMSSKSCAIILNPSQHTSNSLESHSNSPIAGPNLSRNWKVEIIHKSERGNPYKEREKAYWRKRKREDKNQSVKRTKVMWSYEKPQRSCKKECSSSHYSYEEEDDFDDLYLFSDMVGVNPGEASDSSEDSDTSDEESEDESVEIEECLEPLTNNRLQVEEDRVPRSTSSVFLTSKTHDDTNQNSSINPNRILHDPPLHDDPPLDDAHFPYDPPLLEAHFLDPPIVDEPNVSHHNVYIHNPDDLHNMNTSTTPNPTNPSQCIPSNNSDLFCDANNSSRISPEVVTSRPSSISSEVVTSRPSSISPEVVTSRPSSISPEVVTSRPSRKRKWPFPSEPSSTVIIPELKLDVEEDPETSLEKASSLPKLRTLRPRRVVVTKDEASRSVVVTKEEVFEKPEAPEHPRCLTKRSRNRDRKVKLYEKGKMANEKDEARRLRALQVKLNRDRIKFEGIRRDERLKELEKENVILREELEERKVKECEGEKRRVNLEDALEESRKREEELHKLLEEAKKREEQLINQVKEKQKREEDLGEVEEMGNSGIGKEAVNPQGLWTLAPPRSTVRLSHTLTLILIGFILFWSVSRRYRSQR